METPCIFVFTHDSIGEEFLDFQQPWVAVVLFGMGFSHGIGNWNITGRRRVVCLFIWKIKPSWKRKSLVSCLCWHFHASWRKGIIHSLQSGFIPCKVYKVFVCTKQDRFCNGIYVRIYVAISPNLTTQDFSNLQVDDFWNLTFLGTRLLMAGVGEDGPTHQPVEHLGSLRSIPGLAVFRPCVSWSFEKFGRMAIEMEILLMVQKSSTTTWDV